MGCDTGMVYYGYYHRNSTVINLRANYQLECFTMQQLFKDGHSKGHGYYLVNTEITEQYTALLLLGDFWWITFEWSN